MKTNSTMLGLVTSLKMMMCTESKTMVMRVPTAPPFTKTCRPASNHLMSNVLLPMPPFPNTLNQIARWVSTNINKSFKQSCLQSGQKKKAPTAPATWTPKRSNAMQHTFFFPTMNDLTFSGGGLTMVGERKFASREVRACVGGEGSDLPMLHMF